MMLPEKFNLLVLPSVANMQQVVEKFPFPIHLTKGLFRYVEILFRKNETIILHNGIDLREFDFVWLCSSWESRDLAYAIGIYLTKHKVPHTSVEKGTSKITDHMLFSLADIPIPKTLFFGHANTQEIVQKIHEIGQYPIIIKDTKGSRGSLSEYAPTEDILVSKINGLPKNKKFIFQEFIPNEYDWGVMVANGVIVSGEKSYPCEGEFRNNTCNGAKEIFVNPEDIPEEIKRLAINSSDLLNLEWSRTDIIIDKATQKPYVLEVNRLPGITSKTTEVDGAYAYLSSKLTHLEHSPS